MSEVTPQERSPEEFYQSLEIKLRENHNFPEDYLFKFIIPNDNPKLIDIYQVFDKMKYTISTRESNNKKYVSASILAFVMDAEQVIRIYKKVAEIPDVIML